MTSLAMALAKGILQPGKRTPKVRDYIAYSDQKQMENSTSMIRVIGILFLVAGGLGLIYGGFTYTKAVHKTEIGPVVIAVKEKEQINIPLWVGVSALVIGSGLLLASTKLEKQG